MRVYIKGMEMPDGCYYCPFRQGSFGRVPPHRAMCMVTGEVMPVDGKNIQHNQPCPLVPVPPHGRLIDADALIDAGWQLSRDNIFTGKYEIALLSSVPTIIEAKGRETDEDQT